MNVRRVEVWRLERLAHQLSAHFQQRTLDLLLLICKPTVYVVASWETDFRGKEKYVYFSFIQQI